MDVVDFEQLIAAEGIEFQNSGAEGTQGLVVAFASIVAAYNASVS